MRGLRLRQGVASIVSVCGVLSRADFTCQEGAVGLDIVGVGESDWPRLAEVCGPPERGNFAGTIARRYRTDSPSNSDGYPMAIPALCVVRISI